MSAPDLITVSMAIGTKVAVTVRAWPKGQYAGSRVIAAVDIPPPPVGTSWSYAARVMLEQALEAVLDAQSSGELL